MSRLEGSISFTGDGEVRVGDRCSLTRGDGEPVPHVSHDAAILRGLGTLLMGPSPLGEDEAGVRNLFPPPEARAWLAAVGWVRRLRKSGESVGDEIWGETRREASIAEATGDPAGGGFGDGFGFGFGRRSGLDSAPVSTVSRVLRLDPRLRVDPAGTDDGRSVSSPPLADISCEDDFGDGPLALSVLAAGDDPTFSGLELCFSLLASWNDLGGDDALDGGDFLRSSARIDDAAVGRDSRSVRLAKKAVVGETDAADDGAGDADEDFADADGGAGVGAGVGAGEIRDLFVVVVGVAGRGGGDDGAFCLPLADALLVFLADDLPLPGVEAGVRGGR